jgi:hypothetical protein
MIILAVKRVRTFFFVELNERNHPTEEDILSSCEILNKSQQTHL